MGKSYSTHYLSEAMVCVGPVVHVKGVLYSILGPDLLGLTVVV